MKVLHLLDTLAMGGKESFTLGLSKAQKATGMDIAVATFDPGNAFETELQEAGIPWYPFSRQGGLDWSLVKRLRHFITTENFDLIHCHGENPAFYGVLAGMSKFGLPILLTVHASDRSSIPWRHRLQNIFTYRCLRRIVCVSPAIESSLVNREFAPRKKVSTLYNGIPAPVILSQDEIGSLREKMGIGADRPVVICVGRLHPVKNHLLFLDAFALALEKTPDLLLLLVGDGPLRAETEAKILELKIGPQVRMLGLRKDVGPLLSLSDIFALPSWNEGQSISLLEACSFGLGIVASNRGGNPTIVQDGVSGLLVEPDDIQGMAQALTRLASDKGLKKRLGQQAAQSYSQNFSLNTCTAAYSAIYTELTR